MKIPTLFKKLTVNPLIVADLLLILALAFLLYMKIPKPEIGMKPAEGDAGQTAQKMAKKCTQDKMTCYKTELSALTKEKGFAYAEKTLYALQDIDPFTKSCHTIAHYMARQALTNPDKFLDLVDSINVSACGSGFLHGVLEAKLSFDPSVQIDSKMADEICNRGSDDYRKRMCEHFMGHLFLVDKNGSIAQALPTCEGVLPQYTFDCYDGLFMEDHQKLALAEHQIAPEPQYTPQYLTTLQNNCLKYSSVLANACWTEIAEVAAKTYNYDPQKIYKACMIPQDSQSQTACYNKGGTVIVTYPIEVATAKLVAICQPYGDLPRYQSCTSNLIASLMYYSPKFTTRAIQICSNISSSNNWCFGEIGRQLKQFVQNPSERQTLCQTSPVKYKSLCESI